MGLSHFLAIALACCIAMTLVEAQKPLTFVQDADDQQVELEQDQNPQIFLQRDIFEVPMDEEMPVVHEIEKRQAQGERYNNYNNPPKQPGDVGGQRHFPFPPWSWNGGSNRPKPGSCYRPTSNGGGFGSGRAVGGIGINGQQGGNRPPTPPPRPGPANCKFDSNCPGNKKCCYGTCASPSYVG